MATASFDGKVVVWEHRLDDLARKTKGERWTTAVYRASPLPFEPIAQLEGARGGGE